MATKQTKKKKTLKKTPLLAKNRFNLPTLIALVGVLSVVGYYVLTTFAAGPPRLGSCSAKVSSESQYACYRDSAEGWSVSFYLAVARRNPDSAANYRYWAEQVNTKGIASAASSFVTLSAAYGSAADKANWTNLTPEAKVEALYSRVLGRSSDPSGKAYWVNNIKTKGDGQTIASFLNVTSAKSFTNSFFSSKVLDYMAPGWRVTTVVNPPQPPQPPEPPEPPEPPTYEPPAENPDSPGPDYSFVIPDDGSLDGGTDALPSLGEVELDDLSGASEEEIDKIIEEKTTTESGVDSEAAARSYGGKLKILPPEDALAEGANEMRYYLNGKLKATVKKSPYAYTLDTTRLKNGRYVLTIVSYQGGEKLEEYSYVLSVKNTLTFWQKIYNLISAPFAK